MAPLLHIDSSRRGERSHSRRLTREFTVTQQHCWTVIRKRFYVRIEAFLGTRLRADGWSLLRFLSLRDECPCPT